MKTPLLTILTIALQVIRVFGASVLEVENKNAVKEETLQLTCITEGVDSVIKFEHPKNTVAGTCFKTGVCTSTNYGLYQDRPENKTFLNITSYDRGRDDGEWLCVQENTPSNSVNIIGYVRPTNVTAVSINDTYVDKDANLKMEGEAFCIGNQKMSAKLLTKLNCKSDYQESDVVPSIRYSTDTSKCPADELVAEATVVLSDQFRGDKIRFKMQFTHDVLLTQLTSPETVEITFENAISLSQSTTNTVLTSSSNGVFQEKTGLSTPELAGVIVAILVFIIIIIVLIICFVIKNKKSRRHKKSADDNAGDMPAESTTDRKENFLPQFSVLHQKDTKNYVTDTNNDIPNKTEITKKAYSHESSRMVIDTADHSQVNDSKIVENL